MRRSVGSLLPALAACLLMAAAVLMARTGLAEHASLGAVTHLLIETAVGAFAYVLAVLLVARSVARELLDKLRLALHRRPAR